MQRRSVAAMAALVISVGVPQWSAAQSVVTMGREIVRDTVVSVSAARISRLTPDRVSFWIIVDGSAETSADAVARLELKQKAVAEALGKAGSYVTAEKPMLFTVGATPTNNYPPPPSPMQTAKGIIRVTLTQPERIAAVVAAAMTAGASGVSSYSFESTGVDAARRGKIAEAIAAAKADAEAVATALGGKLGALVDISTNGNVQTFFQATQLNLDPRFSGGGSTMAPEITVTTNVSVRYKILR